jgi:hypothetical protein
MPALTGQPGPTTDQADFTIAEVSGSAIAGERLCDGVGDVPNLGLGR